MDGATNNAVVLAALLRHHSAGCGCRKKLHSHHVHEVSSTLGVLCHHEQSSVMKTCKPCRVLCVCVVERVRGSRGEQSICITAKACDANFYQCDRKMQSHDRSYQQLPSDDCQQTSHQLSELAWKHAYLGVVRLHNNGTRLIPTHELVTDGCSISDHAYLTYFIEPASSQSVGWISARQYI